MSWLEKRKHPRYPMALPMLLRVSGSPSPIKAELLDMSLGGCFLRTNVEVELGSSAEIAFSIRPGTECTARGAIVRLHAMVGFGVHFEETNKAFDDFLLDLASLREDLRADFLEQVLDPVCRIG
ncbi:MAG: PilZ domain-containing protein [Deltaproteobacteria bacterium]|nr:PilZ domain-containing protein [Deltaproteobacteria bacterium]